MSAQVRIFHTWMDTSDPEGGEYPIQDKINAFLEENNIKRNDIISFDLECHYSQMFSHMLESTKPHHIYCVAHLLYEKAGA